MIRPDKKKISKDWLSAWEIPNQEYRRSKCFRYEVCKAKSTERNELNNIHQISSWCSPHGAPVCAPTCPVL